jgi:hypothetical protein
LRSIPATLHSISALFISRQISLPLEANILSVGIASCSHVANPATGFFFSTHTDTLSLRQKVAPAP